MSYDDRGNIYVLAKTDNGHFTFEHVQTGQLLHSHNGPYQEAWTLYVRNSDILSRQGHCCVYDLGLGCGSQTLAMLDAFAQNKSLTSLEIVSFDLETLGLEALLENLENFDFAKRHRKFLERAVVCDSFVEDNFSWKFIRGDFASTVFQSDLPKANIICCDFFSVSAHPHLWTFPLLQRLFDLSTDDTILVTYSSATAVRASLLAAGFFVGTSPDLREITRMTIASRDRTKVTVPLDKRWLQKFERSSLPYLESETPETRKYVGERVRSHVQFAS